MHMTVSVTLWCDMCIIGKLKLAVPASPSGRPTCDFSTLSEEATVDELCSKMQPTLMPQQCNGVQTIVGCTSANVLHASHDEECLPQTSLEDTRTSNQGTNATHRKMSVFRSLQ